MHDMPGGAWRNLSMDFLGSLPSGEELMVLVDEYSRFPIVEIIRHLCPKMDATHTSDSDSGDYVFVCYDKLRAKKRPTSRVKMLNSHVTVLVDSGASCNVMDKHTFDKHHTKPQLKRATTKLYPYGAKQPLKLYGKFDTLVESSNCYTNAMFYVADGDSTLLSYETALDLNILSEVNSVREIRDIIDKNLKDISHGIGTYKGGVVKLHIDESVKPTAQPHRRITFHMRKKVEKELQRLEDGDVIEKVTNKPTPWVSPIVIAPKPKSPEEIRICATCACPTKPSNGRGMLRLRLMMSLLT